VSTRCRPAQKGLLVFNYWLQSNAIGPYHNNGTVFTKKVDQITEAYVATTKNILNYKCTYLFK